MTADVPAGAPGRNPWPSRRMLLAIVGGLVAIVIALSAIVADLAIDRATVAAERAETTRIINSLTKQLYWAQERLGEH